jgi:cytoskeletal protein RodZ
MEAQVPTWASWALGVVVSLMLLLLAMYLRKINAELAKNTELTTKTKDDVHSFSNTMTNKLHTLDTKMTEKMHEIEKSILVGFTPIVSHKEMKERVHKLAGEVHILSGDVHLLKSRDDILRLVGQGTKQG